MASEGSRPLLSGVPLATFYVHALNVRVGCASRHTQQRQPEKLNTPHRNKGALDYPYSNIKKKNKSFCMPRFALSQ